MPQSWKAAVPSAPVLDGADPRLLVIVGPCSIHDPEAALDYARRLAALVDEVKDELCVVMRVYFGSPGRPSAGRGSSTIRTSTVAST